MKKYLSVFFLVFIGVLTTSNVFAGVLCEHVAGWQLNFVDGVRGQYDRAEQILADGTPSPADVVLLQSYLSPSNFMASVELDGQVVNIQTHLVDPSGDSYKYEGLLKLRSESTVVKCETR